MIQSIKQLHAYLLLFTLTGCGFTSVEQALVKPALPDTTPDQHASSANTHGAPTQPATKKTLYAQYAQWKGTQHRLGGMTKDGIDCSGLVYRTFKEKFGVSIPRTTEYQSQAGIEIDREQLSAGDLVFFKTGFKSRHVGIYIEKGKFLHVSSKKGVKVSKMNDYYWRDRFWQARRVML